MIDAVLDLISQLVQATTNQKHIIAIIQQKKGNYVDNSMDTC